MRSSALVVLLAWTVPALAGPVEFGMREIERAMTDRGLRPGQIRFRTEVAMEKPESFRIAPGVVSGGDLRGLMYGLLEAADQIRETGRLKAARGAPAVPVRGIRMFVHNRELDEEWYYSRDYWQDFFAMLARNRFNRFNLVFAHQTAYLAPPYPYWVALEQFPGVRAAGLSDAERDRNLETLRYISQTAADYAIDFTLGIWEHNVQRGMQPSVEGLTPENLGPYTRAALARILAACPAIRSVQIRTNSESGIPADRQVGFYRDFVFRAIREAGRRVTLDLRGWSMAGGMIEAAKSAGVPLRLSSKYWAEHLGRPYQPAETFRGYSYMNLLEKPRPYDFLWEVWALGSHRLLLWGDPAYVRRAASTFTLSGSSGFEIDPPLAQKGFGNAPGKWGVFAEGQEQRKFWRWDFERYWMFYLLWGRLTYDPDASDRIWKDELKRRFGSAGADVLAAYQAASGVLSEIVAAHLDDPNMYVWPEINPGGALDHYIEVPPSDGRFVASIAEAAGNRVTGAASAKQTPPATAALLDDLAARTEAALDRARGRVPVGSREWLSTEPDFRILAALARYHARKQAAAAEVAYFDQTGDADSLRLARRETEAALETWERLARVTDGIYPARMVYGPDDIGHWKDKLPYVRHDLRRIEQREKLLEQYGRFDFGFDFGGATPAAPRFARIEPDTTFTDKTGYGWIGAGEREAHARPPVPLLEARSVAPDPRHLPENDLYGDWIRGRGPQTFRVRSGSGEFAVSFVRPDGTAAVEKLTARNGYLDVVFPEGEWTVSGLVLKGAGPTAPPPERRPWSRQLARPGIVHTPPKSAAAGQPLALSLRVSPVSAATSVRLWYRPLDQLATFKMLESPAAKAIFTIPAEDVTARWDLMYYFEILNKDGGGWFDPDPRVATPYHVVATQ